MASAASCCAIEAGLDHLARAQALEEARHVNGARVVSLAPGVIDTDMQVQLRGADAAAFPDRENFVRFQHDGRLASSAEAAAKVVRYLDRADSARSPWAASAT